MPFCGTRCSLLFCLLLFSISLLSFYGLVLWFWSLRTDGVLIAFSQPYTANLLNNNNYNNVHWTEGEPLAAAMSTRLRMNH